METPADLTPETPPQPDAWLRTDWEAEARQLSTPSTSGRHPTLRVHQLDAEQLDGELADLLREKLASILQNVGGAVNESPSVSVARYTEEMRVLVGAIIAFPTIWSGGPTPGSELLGLRYRDEASAPSAGVLRTGVEGAPLRRSQRLIHGIGLLLGRYLWLKLDQHARICRWADAPDGSWRRRTSAALRRAETLYQVLSFANLLAFLKQGRYRSLWERALRMRLVLERPELVRLLNFEHMNRELVWHELSEALMFLVPLVDFSAARKVLKRISGLAARSAGGAAEALALGGSAPGAGGSTQPALLAECGHCGAAPIVQPYSARPCGHVFCYFCLRAKMKADGPGAGCPLCGVRLTAIQRRVVGAASAGATPGAAGAGAAPPLAARGVTPSSQAVGQGSRPSSAATDRGAGAGAAQDGANGAGPVTGSEREESPAAGAAGSTRSDVAVGESSRSQRRGRRR